MIHPQEDIGKKSCDYILQAKNNRHGLVERIEKVFEITKPFPIQTGYNIGHGRNETRACRVIDELRHFDNYKD